MDKGRGSVGTLLIQEGTLKQGDFFVCGIHSGKVRAMFNDQGRKMKKAGPAMPVEVQGFDGVPEAGDEFVVVARMKNWPGASPEQAPDETARTRAGGQVQGHPGILPERRKPQATRPLPST